MAVSGGAGRVIEQSPMERVPGDKATWTELRRANYRISRGGPSECNQMDGARRRIIHTVETCGCGDHPHICRGGQAKVAKSAKGLSRKNEAHPITPATKMNGPATGNRVASNWRAQGGYVGLRVAGDPSTVVEARVIGRWGDSMVSPEWVGPRQGEDMFRGIRARGAQPSPRVPAVAPERERQRHAKRFSRAHEASEKEKKTWENGWKSGELDAPCGRARRPTVRFLCLVELGSTISHSRRVHTAPVVWFYAENRLFCHSMVCACVCIESGNDPSTPL